MEAAADYLQRRTARPLHRAEARLMPRSDTSAQCGASGGVAGKGDRMATLISGLGGVAGFAENAHIREDDLPTDLIDLRSIFPNGLNFFGKIREGLYISNNGAVTFEAGIFAYTPTIITDFTDNPIIAPF